MDHFEQTNYLFNEHNFCHERCTTCKGFRVKFGLNENRLVEYNETDEEIVKMKLGDILMGDLSKVGWTVVRATNISNNDIDSLNTFKQ